MYCPRWRSGSSEPSCTRTFRRLCDAYRPGRRLLGLLQSSLQTFGSIARHAPGLLGLFKKAAQGPHGAVRLAAVSSLGGALAGAHDEVRAMLQAMAHDRHEL